MEMNYSLALLVDCKKDKPVEWQFVLYESWKGVRWTLWLITIATWLLVKNKCWTIEFVKIQYKNANAITPNCLLHYQLHAPNMP